MVTAFSAHSMGVVQPYRFIDFGLNFLNTIERPLFFMAQDEVEDPRKLQERVGQVS